MYEFENISEQSPMVDGHGRYRGHCPKRADCGTAVDAGTLDQVVAPRKLKARAMWRAGGQFLQTRYYVREDY